MRAYQLYENKHPGRYDPSEDVLNVRHPDDTRKPKITLRDINRLKKIRAVRKLEQLKKQDFVHVMYGDPELARQAREQELDFERQEHELNMIKDQIGTVVDGAELDRSKKDHIAAMAQQAIGTTRKS